MEVAFLLLGSSITDASVSRRRQRVTVITLALEGSIHVNAVAIITHSCVLTFIVVCGKRQARK